MDHLDRVVLAVQELQGIVSRAALQSPEAAQQLPEEVFWFARPPKDLLKWNLLSPGAFPWLKPFLRRQAHPLYLCMLSLSVPPPLPPPSTPYADSCCTSICSLFVCLHVCKPFAEPPPPAFRPLCRQLLHIQVFTVSVSPCLCLTPLAPLLPGPPMQSAVAYLHSISAPCQCVYNLSELTMAAKLLTASVVGVKGCSCVLIWILCSPVVEVCTGQDVGVPASGLCLA